MLLCYCNDTFITVQLKLISNSEVFTKLKWKSSHFFPLVSCRESR